jgi:hypothetical protein
MLAAGESSIPGEVGVEAAIGGVGEEVREVGELRV